MATIGRLRGARARRPLRVPGYHPGMGEFHEIIDFPRGKSSPIKRRDQSGRLILPHDRLMIGLPKTC